MALTHNFFRELAITVDCWRIFPRIFVLTYIYLVHEVTVWFMSLPDPNTQQATLVTIVVGGAVGFFTAYANTGSKTFNRMVEDKLPLKFE